MSKREMTEEEAQEVVNEFGKKIDSAEALKNDVLDKEVPLKKLFSSAKVLKALWDDFIDVLCLLKDWFAGRYTDVPWCVIASLAGALLYVISPIDLIPDFIPFVGFVDDAAVFTAAVKLCRVDLGQYRDWLATQKIS